MNRREKTGKQILLRNARKTALTLVVGLASACDQLAVVDTGNKPSEVLTYDSVNVLGAAPASCPAVTSSVLASGKYLQFSYANRACARVTACLDPETWKKLPENTYVPGIDVVIVFDATGSMGPYREALVKNLQQLINNLNGLTPSLRLGLATFQDFADSGGQANDVPYRPLVSLTSDVNAVRDKLGQLKVDAGGDTPETLATAIRATVDGKPMGKYFGASDMGFTEDPSRVKIVLGVTDAPNKRHRLPAGAATLDEVAQLLKKKGILFFGIGTRKSSTLSAPVAGSAESGQLTKADGTPNYGDYTSYADLATLARVTGAIISEPGLDLNGDGKILTNGEIPAGEPAVLVMNSNGTLRGAPAGADSTKVLANAITSMVKRVKPFQFALNVNGGGHSFLPATNVMTLSPQINEQRCFSTVVFGRIESSGCPSSSDVGLWVTEELSGTSIDAQELKARFEVDLNCIGDVTNVPGPVPTPTATQDPSDPIPGGYPSTTPSGSPSATPTVTATPSPTSSVTPSPTPSSTESPEPEPTQTCTDLSCGGGAIGL